MLDRRTNLIFLSWMTGHPPPPPVHTHNMVEVVVKFVTGTATSDFLVWIGCDPPFSTPSSPHIFIRLEVVAEFVTGAAANAILVWFGRSLRVSPSLWSFAVSVLQCVLYSCLNWAEIPCHSYSFDLLQGLFCRVCSSAWCSMCGSVLQWVLQCCTWSQTHILIQSLVLACCMRDLVCCSVLHCVADIPCQCLIRVRARSL